MILLLTPFYSPNLGGVEVHLSDFVNYLNEKKVETTVLTYQPVTVKVKAPFKEKSGKITILRFPYPGFNLFYHLERHPGIQFLYLFSGIFLYSFFFLFFNQRKIKIIHAHGLAAALATGLLGKIFKKRTVVSLHTIYKFSEGSGNSSYAKQILGLVDRVLAIAEGCKDDLVKIGVDKKKITVYSYWVNTKKFKPLPRIECRKKLGLSSEKLIGLFVGRFNPEKQIKEALETARLTPEIDFLFIGQGPLENEVKKYALKNKNIKLIGRINNQDIPIYHNASDFLLLGSVDEDYFGKVTMEAIVCGLPAIIADESCYFGKRKKINPDLLPSSCGFVVPLDPLKISVKLREIVRSPQKIRRLRHSCRLFGVKRFGFRNASVIYNSYLQ